MDLKATMVGEEGITVLLINKIYTAEAHHSAKMRNWEMRLWTMK